MNYHLLTGATGLLGQYILRDALRAGLHMAVLARGDASAPASQRVDALLRRFEGELGFALPRPVVLEGDLRRPDCGLSPAAVAWIGEHCTAVIHNAASITFQSAPSGEPRLTNVDGARHLLNVCQQAGVRHWHHVSTAYVCGLRHGTVLECELDVGQQFGNDYERSKLEAEQMVRQASHLDQVTVLRPSIIVGDSQTGYTSTFHGLYAPLQLLLPLARAAPATNAGLSYFEKLGMRGEEGKNFVPVDWVAAVLVHIIANRRHHGQTYHLTADRPVPVQLIDATLGEVILSRPVSKVSGPAVGKGAIDRRFLEQMDVYRAYFRDDAQFDTTNTRRAAPHLPCPVIDKDMLCTLARYAISANFGWPRQSPAPVEFEVQQLLSDLSLAAARRNAPPRLALNVLGSGGGQWEIGFDKVRPASVSVGIGRDPSATACLNSSTMFDLVEGELTVEEAVYSGRLLIEAQPELLASAEAWLQALLAAMRSPGSRIPSGRGSAGPKSKLRQPRSKRGQLL